MGMCMCAHIHVCTVKKIKRPQEEGKMCVAPEKCLDDCHWMLASASNQTQARTVECSDSFVCVPVPSDDDFFQQQQQQAITMMTMMMTTMRWMKVNNNMTTMMTLMTRTMLLALVMMAMMMLVMLSRMMTWT